MQTFISKYGLAAHLAILAVTPLFLCPFCSAGTVGVVLLWLSLMAMVWLFMEPSRRAEERLHEARLRVRQEVCRDPLLWLMGLIVAFNAIRTLNGGITRIYDSSLHRWVLDGPAYAMLPGHADDAAFLPFATSVALLVLLQGCRHALGKSARIAVVAMISQIAGLGALIAVFGCLLGNEGALQLAGFSNGSWEPSFASDFFVSSAGTSFGLCLLGSLVATTGMFECKWNRILLLFAFSIGASATGLFYFATPVVFAAYMLLAVVFLLICVIYLLLTARISVVLRFAVTIFLSLSIPLLLILCVAPEEMTTAHSAVFGQVFSGPRAFFPEGFAVRREALIAQAIEIWRSSPWLGRGLGVYPLELWLSGGAANGLLSSGPLHGWWFILAERGILGVVLLGLPLLFMTFTFIQRIIGSLGRHVFLPLVILGVVSLFSMIGLSWIDCSSFRPDALLIGGTFFALAASAFPIRKKRVDTEVEAGM